MDDVPIADGDDGFVGVDQYTTPENLGPRLVQDAVNVDFSTQDAVTRGGFVCTASVAFGWTLRTQAQSNSWSSVTFGDNLFVAVSRNAAPGPTTNQVMTSPDGTAWTIRSSSMFGTWVAVAFGSGTYVAVNSDGVAATAIMTSADGITWTTRSASEGSSWNSVTYGNGLFVAVAQAVASDGVMTSPDGITWTSRTSAANNRWKSVAYGNGVFVAVSTTGTGNRVMSSSDGITWTARASAADDDWTSVAYGNGVFVAVALAGSGSRIMTSPDGVTWTARANPESARAWVSVVYGAGSGIFVAVSNGPHVIVSSDGITWSTRTIPSSWSGSAITYGKGLFVGVSGNSTIAQQVLVSSGGIYASSNFSDPNDPGAIYVALAGAYSAFFYAHGSTPRVVDYPSGEEVSEQSTLVQANNKVYIFRGPNETPLVWDGDWSTTFTVATGSIPASVQALYCQNRLWAIDGKDTLSASDVLDFTTWNNLDNSFNLSKGDSNYLVTTYPFGDTTILVFKNRSILAISGVDGSLGDIVATEITRQVGAIGINAVVSVGPDVVYMSDRNINLITLTATNNAVQHKTLPLSRNIQRLFNRVNWNFAYKVSMGYNDNKLYVAIPLDNSTVCNAVVVYNFVTENWYGEWNFADGLGMSIQGWAVANYLGLQRMHAITEDGRIFVTDEGSNDITGTTVAEISSSVTTRAYRMTDENRVNRRMWADISTWRPSYSVTAYVDGASESSALITNQTYSRSQSWIFGDSMYNLNNSGDNYNRAGRKDYAGLPSESIQPQSGFLPEMRQDYRIPLIFRRKGRLVWYKVENAQGVLSLNGIGGEARTGDRNNFTQVL
ncbi:MAG TPA: hypothetical protein VEC57_00055 [Candidatus Limnocylindrales bacterium]|nr:hypothetical protein [Candidatus Limnocylindrales bacterium]